jgi:protein-disulfide isomerase
MVRVEQLKNVVDNSQDKLPKKRSWRGCCILIAIFVATFVLAFLGFAVWDRYQKISQIDLPDGVSIHDLKTADRQLVESPNDPFWGNPAAQIVIVEFSDFECPFCKQMFPILRALNSDYPNQLKFIYRDFLGHSNSQKAAEAAECANEQGKFLAYHDKLFLNQSSLDINSLKLYARQIGISDINKFDQCLDGNKFELEVKQDYQEAIQLGVQGTPTFFINGIKIPGAVPKEVLEKIIDELMKK